MSSHALTDCLIRRATEADALRLTEMARESFVQTFAADNTPTDMAMYTAASFGEDIQRTELRDSRNTIFVAEHEERVIGYVMLCSGPAPECVTSACALEINRLYVSHRHHGTGVGAALMQRSIDEAEQQGSDAIWLGVWEHNRKAIQFYTRWGFMDVGTQPFLLGQDRQTDRIMSRPVLR